MPAASGIFPTPRWWSRAPNGKTQRSGAGRRGSEESSKEQLEGIEVRPIDYRPGTAVPPFESSYDLYGDGSLILLSTPGHTPGHQSLLVTLGSGKKVLLTGDAVWVAENYLKPSPKGWFVRHFEEEEAEAWRATLAIQKFRQAHPEILIIPGHDPHLWDKLPKVLE